MRLREVLNPRLKTNIDYIYDFGDCWEHRLTVTDVRAAGAGRFLSTLHQQAKEMDGPKIAAASRAFMNCSKSLPIPRTPFMPTQRNWSADYDPNTFDELPIKYALGRIANRRNAARSRLAKKKPLSSPA